MAAALTRRAFFRRAAVAASALAIADDPERLLWTPGARKIFVPPSRMYFSRFFVDGAIREMQEQYNYQLSEMAEALARHGLPPAPWWPHPIELIPPVRTVRLDWTDADFAT